MSEVQLEISTGPDSKRIKLTSNGNHSPCEKPGVSEVTVEVKNEKNDVVKEPVKDQETGEDCQNGNGNHDSDNHEEEEILQPGSIDKDKGNGIANAKVTLKENQWFTEGSKGNVEEISKSWEGSQDKSENGFSIFNKPFRHGELKEFVGNVDFVRDFVKLFSKIDFEEKASDLFQFNQSDDLSFIVDPHVFAINEYLLTKVLPFLKKVTGLPLNETLSMFLSIYKQTDFLLCHDDELESRRIAFIWYLSEDWCENYGGSLDLYSATESLHPDQVVKKVVPEFNKLVFFEVGPTSFHQVSEVLKEDKSRLALSGWFYGEPLARPKIEFPVDVSFNVLESSLSEKGILKKFIAEMYHNPEIYSEINEQLAEDSEVLVPGLLRDDVYASICQSIVEADLEEGTAFQLRGPANLSHYKEAIVGPPSQTPSSSSSNSPTPTFTMSSLPELFYSREFLQVMEQITEFPFTTCDTNRVTSSLQKYSHGSYSLMKTGGTKQTGYKPSPEEEVDEDEEDPNYVDIMFFFANKWEEVRGGKIVYSTTDGEQLITVDPEGNCLAIVVRSSTVNAYTNYVNCLAKDDVFFVYKMTFAFDGNM